ncbi:hypothetical protein P8452_56780 [Trifolium repens]|nr:hypothetical protein P8452_56780 [Trifolium repens]
MCLSLNKEEKCYKSELLGSQETEIFSFKSLELALEAPGIAQNAQCSLVNGRIFWNKLRRMRQFGAECAGWANQGVPRQQMQL